MNVPMNNISLFRKKEELCEFVSLLIIVRVLNLVLPDFSDYLKSCVRGSQGTRRLTDTCIVAAGIKPVREAFDFISWIVYFSISFLSRLNSFSYSASSRGYAM